VLAGRRWLGGWLSLACAVHCLATPLLLSFAQHAGARALLLDERAEGSLLAASLLFSGHGLRRGFLLHRKMGALLLMGVACLALAAGQLAVVAYGEILVVAGSLALAAANLLDHQLHCRCVRCHSGGEPTRSTDASPAT
jgi:hypothetical protein